MKAHPPYRHILVYECVSVGVRGRSRGSVWALARISICTACLYRCVNACVCKHIHAASVRDYCMHVCVHTVCVCVCVHVCMCLRMRGCVCVSV